MRKHLLSIGSCQSSMILKYLRTCPDFQAKYANTMPHKQVYEMDDADIAALHDRLQTIDVLLIQPATDEYRSRFQKDAPYAAASAIALANAVDIFPPFDGTPQVHAALTEESVLAITGRKPIPEALKAAAARITAIVSEKRPAR